MLHNTVLVVEDKVLLAMVLEDALADAGYSSITAGGAQEAISLLSHSGNEPIALVTDIRLGEGSGWDVGDAARTLFPLLPVIYTSGDSGSDWRQRGVLHSIFLQKPMTGRSIADAVRSLTGGQH